MKKIPQKSVMELLNEEYSLVLINNELPSIGEREVKNVFEYTSDQWKAIYLEFQTEGRVRTAYLIKCIFQDLDWGILKAPNL